MLCIPSFINQSWVLLSIRGVFLATYKRSAPARRFIGVQVIWPFFNILLSPTNKKPALCMFALRCNGNKQWPMMFRLIFPWLWSCVGSEEARLPNPAKPSVETLSGKFGPNSYSDPCCSYPHLFTWSKVDCICQVPLSIFL